MMKRILVIVFASFYSLGAHAQQATVSSGGDVTSTTGSVSFSIGQVSYGSAQATAGNINQGVQQPFEIVTSNSQHLMEQAGWMVYPNPTLGQLTVESTSDTKPFQWSLFDANGRLVTRQESNDSQATIDMSDVVPASYHLQITTAENKTIHYTIIKNDIR